MGKPESPHPGRRGLVERVRVRWVKELRIQESGWRELDEEEISCSEKEEKKEWKEGDRQEIEKKKKD